MIVKKFLIGAVASAGMVVAMSGPAFAGNAGDGSGYGTQPGHSVSNDHTVCAGHGSFGAFGKDASLGTEKVHATFLQSYPGPGTDGTQTGINNSNLCGNPQN